MLNQISSRLAWVHMKYSMLDMTNQLEGARGRYVSNIFWKLIGQHHTKYDGGHCNGGSYPFVHKASLLYWLPAQPGCPVHIQWNPSHEVPLSGGRPLLRGHFLMHFSSSLWLLWTPLERPPTSRNHLLIAKGVASWEGFHCTYIIPFHSLI